MTRRLVYQVIIEPQTPEESRQGQRTWLYTRELFSLSEQRARAYAQRVGADYECVRDRSYRPDLGLCFQRMKFFEYAAHYDQMLYLDADIVVFDTAPDIFEQLKPGLLTAVQDGDWDSTRPTWQKYLSQKQRKYRSSSSYRPFCSGLLLMDSQWADSIRPVFEQQLPSSLNQSQGDQYLLNRMVVAQGEQYNELGAEWGRWDRRGQYMDHVSVPRRRGNFSIERYLEQRRRQGLVK